MYTSGTEPTARTAVKTALVYLLLSLFCVLFGAVYELFSHGVYSFSMIYAFVFPLAGGALPFLLLGFCKMKKYPGGTPSLSFRDRSTYGWEHHAGYTGHLRNHKRFDSHLLAGGYCIADRRGCCLPAIPL